MIRCLVHIIQFMLFLSLGANSSAQDETTTPIVVMETSLGTVEIELWPAQAPETVKNFLRYVDNNLYDNLTFHRAIPGFMIQGGGYDRNFIELSSYPPITNEARPELRNDRGTIAMARTNVINSSTSQFFINQVDNEFLNRTGDTPQSFGHAVFGRVISGMDVVDQIAAVKTVASNQHQNVPVEPVIILNMSQLSHWTTEVYNIDRLRVTHQVLRNTSDCTTGEINRLVVEGPVGPDSSFAVERLLQRIEPCTDTNGDIATPISVSLNSVGGMMEDGYKMGHVFRASRATVIVEEGSLCASSCAVAFLGGTDRTVENGGAIMFHAPYYGSVNVVGEIESDCDVGQDALDELRSYYVKMVGNDDGGRLFERTMSYCSSNDGWLVQGASAAELFGIATRK